MNALICLFIELYPDAFFMATLANFEERGIDSLCLADGEDEDTSRSFFHSRLFQTFKSFASFPEVLSMHIPRFIRIILILLSGYCDAYSHREKHTAMLNVTFFVIYSLHKDAAKEAIKEISTAMEFPYILNDVQRKKHSILHEISPCDRSRVLKSKLNEFFSS
jgi:hypothetical protein